MLVRARPSWLLTLKLVGLGGALPAGITAPVAAEATERQEPAHPLATALAAAAQEHLSAGTVPGILIAAAERGEVIYTDGLGWANVKDKRPMTASTPINVGSISKSIAAWGFLRFCRGEGLALDAPVLPLVPELELPGARAYGGDGVNVRRVLSHTAGLSTPSAPVVAASQSLPSLSSILERGAGGVPRLELQQPPGLGFSYSGGGYLLLQLVLETRAGERFATFMAREILEPAGMSSSSFRLTPALRERSATYYRSRLRVRATYHLPGAAGALYSTAEEMGRWLTLYAADSSERARLLDEAEFRELLAPQAPIFIEGVDTRGSLYALGHAIWRSPEGSTYAFHGGGNPGLRAFFFVVPATGNGLFLAANHDDGQRVFRTLIDTWARHYQVTPPPLF